MSYSTKNKGVTLNGNYIGFTGLLSVLLNVSYT